MRHETFPIESPPARDDAARARITIRCEVRQGVQPWRLVRLVDLSETGFKLAWLPVYDETKPVSIRIPGIEPLKARIRWHKAKQIGCEFVSPLHVAVFDHIVRLAGGARD